MVMYNSIILLSDRERQNGEYHERQQNCIMRRQRIRAKILF